MGPVWAFFRGFCARQVFFSNSNKLNGSFHMKVTETKLEKLIPYARNPRKNGGAVDAVGGNSRIWFQATYRCRQ